MKTKRIETNCFECKTEIKITKKQYSEQGNNAMCLDCRAEFLAWLGNLYKLQN